MYHNLSNANSDIRTSNQQAYLPVVWQHDVMPEVTHFFAMATFKGRTCLAVAANIEYCPRLLALGYKTYSLMTWTRHMLRVDTNHCVRSEVTFEAPRGHVIPLTVLHAVTYSTSYTCPFRKVPLTMCRPSQGAHITNIQSDTWLVIEVQVLDKCAISNSLQHEEKGKKNCSTEDLLFNNLSPPLTSDLSREPHNEQVLKNTSLNDCTYNCFGHPWFSL